MYFTLKGLYLSFFPSPDLLCWHVARCEFIGGMTSVAWTDAIQCSILFGAIVFMPILASAKWGDFNALGGDGTADCDTLREKFTPHPISPYAL